MSRGFVSIEPDGRVAVTHASKGAQMQQDLTVAFVVAERMQATQAQKLLYGVVTTVEIAAMQRIIAAFAAETQRVVNEEGAAKDAAIIERRERVEARKRQGTPAPRSK